MTRSHLGWLTLPLLGLLSGCGVWTEYRRNQAQEATQHQLERVAKDWSQMIGASQIIPVYPMTEDLVPGDVFLVTTPIDRQREAYRDKGYLPLAHHLYRIKPCGYENFYSPEVASNNRCSARRTLERYPRAAFPSYSFQLNEERGFRVALPLSAINLGLGLLASDNIEGTVSLQDAYTYGVDVVSLTHDVMGVLRGLDRDSLSFYGRPLKDPEANYIRVVSRVFLVKKVSVSMVSRAKDQAKASAEPGLGLLPGMTRVPTVGELGNLVASQQALICQSTPGAVLLRKVDAVGGVICQPPRLPDLPKAPKSPKLPEPKTIATPITGSLFELADSALDTLGAVLPKAGGEVSFTSLRQRSVSMEETFQKPLVIGYLGFDMQILEDGRFGPPLPTFIELNQKPELRAFGRVNVAIGARQSREAAAKAKKDQESFSCNFEPIECYQQHRRQPKIAWPVVWDHLVQTRDAHAVGTDARAQVDAWVAAQAVKKCRRVIDKDLWALCEDHEGSRAPTAEERLTVRRAREDAYRELNQQIARLVQQSKQERSPP
ncbi:MAG TPA: hypothetical protein VFV27_06005 [Nevskiaceae bacterium]|nr:hypothetical protein [Nevskiaceae bacterium]